MKKRKGFTLIEIIACTMLMALIVMACASLTNAITAQKTVTESTVLLSAHNLNCMEKLRQLASELDNNLNSYLQNYYGDDEFGTSSIETHVYTERATLDSYYVYRVQIISKMRDKPQKLTSSYILTSIGLQYYDSSSTSVTEDSDVTLS